MRSISLLFCLTFLCNLSGAARISSLRASSQTIIGESGGEAWAACALEGEAIPNAGLARFGWSLAWVESDLLAGATCGAASFGGSDPAPGIRKSCECIPNSEDGGTSREELGVVWDRCGLEGETCDCPSGTVRFGTASRWIVREFTSFQPLKCTGDSFSGADPAPQTVKECWCETGREGAVPTVRTAIVLDSRRPPDLKEWLQYHLEYMKVDHIFMQVEDTPGFSKAFAALAPGIRQRVSVWTPPKRQRSKEKRPKDDYEDLQRRQLILMRKAKEESKKMGIDWLIHVDDDELLYTPLHRTIGDVLGSMPKLFDQATIPNVEAVYKSAGVKSCFAETTEVNVNPYAYVSYANGKSAVRVSNQDAIPAGPHHWKTAHGDLASLNLDKEPFGPPLMVLHYESCPFNRWEQKYWELSHTTQEKVNSIPFPFYRDSITRMMECSRDISDGVIKPAASGDCSEKALEELWATYKTEQNPRIRKRDVMAITIPWDKVMALTPAL